MPVYRGPVAIIYTTACNKSCACANNESPRLESTVKLSDSAICLWHMHCGISTVQRGSRRYLCHERSEQKYDVT